MVSDGQTRVPRPSEDEIARRQSTIGWIEQAADDGYETTWAVDTLPRSSATQGTCSPTCRVAAGRALASSALYFGRCARLQTTWRIPNNLVIPDGYWPVFGVEVRTVQAT